MIENSIIDPIYQNLREKTFVFALEHGNNTKKQILSETINKLGGVSNIAYFITIFMKKKFF
jgi:hypothetical protein